jgi:antitoxin HicB
MLQYPALFEPDREAGGYVVTFPDFSFGVTQGETLEEALLMASDLLKILIADCVERNLDLPRPSKQRDKRYRLVSLSALQDTKATLYQAWRDSGIRKAALARRLGISKPGVDRLFSLDHRSRLDQLEAAFAALNKKLLIQVQNAA